MDSLKTMKLLEVRTADGALLLTLRIIEAAGLAGEEKPAGSAKEEPGRSPAPDKNGEPMMTDPQKGYLFRLLAEKGIENDSAYEELIKQFNVKSLKEVTKFEDSKEIERLLSEQKGGKSYEH